MNFLQAWRSALRVLSNPSRPRAPGFRDTYRSKLCRDFNAPMGPRRRRHSGSVLAHAGWKDPTRTRLALLQTRGERHVRLLHAPRTLRRGVPREAQYQTPLIQCISPQDDAEGFVICVGYFSATPAESAVVQGQGPMPYRWPSSMASRYLYGMPAVSHHAPEPTIPHG